MTVCHAGMCLFLSLKSLNLMVRLTEFIQNIMMTLRYYQIEITMSIHFFKSHS
uniref:Uncharacterized protein n=1 Tax=Anguilla anguilla TaxID=7936 RepID=A0A0E9VAH6_ANGAN